MKLVDKLRLSQKSLSKPHDVLRNDIVPEAEHNNPVVVFGRIIANVSEIQISAEQNCSSGLSMCRDGAIRRSSESDVSGELCFMSKPDNEFNDRARKVCVDQEAHWSSGRRQRVE
jgi:hypothetical protein